MKIHPVADLFPLLQGDEFRALCEDIKRNGLNHPIVTYRGMLLDGRNRRRACEAAGVPLKFLEYEGDSPTAFIISENVRRRHLNPSQQAMIGSDPTVLGELEKEAAARQKSAGAKGAEHGAKGAEHGAKGGRGNKKTPLPELIREGGFSEKPEPHHDKPTRPRKRDKSGESASKAVESLGLTVSGRYVQQAKAIREKAPGLVAAVMSGDKTITQAKREIKEANREAQRAENAALVATAPDPTKIEGVYSTIVLDPPWDFKDEGDQDVYGRTRPVYAQMPFEDVVALPVAKLAAADAHIYLWITNRSLPKGFHLLDEWGFRYITLITWCKDHYGTGNYFRGQTEHLMFGVRGSLPLKRKDVGNWFQAKRGGARKQSGDHSGKPDAAYDLIESCSHGPYLEMFAGRKRDGWICWGAEA